MKALAKRDFARQVAALPWRERLVVEMRYRDGRPFRWIARGFGLTPRQVRRLYRKAMRRLRALLVDLNGTEASRCA